ncbi:hypothetical protein SCHIN_v1c11850 [Spiroplasma chinense]|uniref:Uncharacterized protein n=1 Tax=Spiroplasma chinense TaxID=216932 RepID=A0A5B9Y5D5_9MOLU|nr:hypothetical protein [Spiroplasma chinense]QEH62378.1 hypothetical protein SCHIN_v1c11850 [Spiroplasma chinense]
MKKQAVINNLKVFWVILKVNTRLSLISVKNWICVALFVMIIFALNLFISLIKFNDDGIASLTTWVLIKFMVIIALSIIFVVFISINLFTDHKTNGYLKTEQRNGINLYTSFFTRVLAINFIVIIANTILVLLTLLTFFTSNLGDNWNEFVLSPTLSLYFFLIFFTPLAIFAVSMLSDLFSLLLMGFLSLIIVASPLLSMAAFYKDNGLISNKNLVLSQGYRQDIKMGSNFYNLLNDDTNYKNVIEESLSAFWDDLTIESHTEQKIDWINILGWTNNAAEAQIVDSNEPSFYKQLNIGLLFFLNVSGENSQNFETIFGDSKLGKIISELIRVTSEHQDEFVKFKYNAKDRDNPALNNKLEYFVPNSYTYSRNSEPYEFEGYIKTLKKYLSNENKKFADLVLNSYANYSVPDQLGIDREILRDSKSFWDTQISKYNPIKAEFKDSNKTEILKEKNKELAEIYTNYPGLAIFNNILTNLLVRSYYLDTEGEVKNPDASGEQKYIIKNSYDFLDLQKKLNKFNKVNLLNHFYQIFNSNLNNERFYILNLSWGIIKMPANENVIYDAKELEKMNDINNEISYYKDNKVKFSNNSSVGSLISIYLILSLLTYLVSSFIFVKRSKV